LRSSLATSLLPQMGQVAFENLRPLLCDIALTTKFGFSSLDKTNYVPVVICSLRGHTVTVILVTSSQ
jgi:hypothetical protein